MESGADAAADQHWGTAADQPPAAPRGRHARPDDQTVRAPGHRATPPGGPPAGSKAWPRAPIPCWSGSGTTIEDADHDHRKLGAMRRGIWDAVDNAFRRSLGPV